MVGCGGHARFLLSLVGNSCFEAFGLISLEDEFDDSELIMEVPVIGCLSFIDEQYKLGRLNIVLGIGDNSLRKKTFLQLTEAGFQFPNLVHSSAIIDSTTILGSGNVIGPNVVIGAEVAIGNNNIINSGAVIEHQSLIGDHSHVSLSAIVCGNVSIGSGAFLGANSTVIDKLLVSDDTTLGAGGTLVSSTRAPGLTFVGCPAKENKK